MNRNGKTGAQAEISRDAVIVRTSVVGIVTNVFLAAFKAAIGKPMRAPEILDFIYKYDIEIVTIPEEDILPARAALARRGVYAEHTTAGNYAAYLRYVKLHGRTPDSLITMCGAGLKSDH